MVIVVMDEFYTIIYIYIKCKMNSTSVNLHDYCSHGWILHNYIYIYKLMRKILGVG